MSFQQYFNCRDQLEVINNLFNIPAQARTGHQLSTPYHFRVTALAPPSFASRPGTVDVCHLSDIPRPNA